MKALDDAALWLSWQRGGHWGEAEQRGFDLWLAESHLHRLAYEQALAARERRRIPVRRLTRLNVVMADRPRGRRFKSPALFALAAAVVVGIGLAILYGRDPTYVTTVGEQRVLVLDDGTEVLLNTATKMAVDFDRLRRHVRLLKGEALFTVSKDATRPFIVEAADQQITALGTQFAVRRDETSVAITLVEGQVAVADTAIDDRPVAPLILAPGDRVTVAAQTRTLDRPEIGREMSWQQGVVNLSALPLEQAAAEINRYNAIKIRIEGPAAKIRVGGIFRARDPRAFAEAVSASYGLSLRTTRDGIVLSGPAELATEDSFDRARK